MEEAKFRWQVIAVAICLAVCLIIVLPVLALIDPVKERKPRVKTAILLLIDLGGPDETHLFTFAPFIMLEHSGLMKRPLVTSLAVVPFFFFLIPLLVFNKEKKKRCCVWSPSFL